MLLRIGSKCINIGVGGDVLEITFTSVKAQDFDNTTTTILIFSKFKVYYINWRNKNLCGGVKIKRFVNIVVMAA